MENSGGEALTGYGQTQSFMIMRTTRTCCFGLSSLTVSSWLSASTWVTTFFCKSLRGGGGEYNCLNAAVPTITQDARLELEEVVMLRSFYNVNFHVLDARVYNQRVVTMATGDAINRAKEQNTVDMKLSYKEIRSSTWNTSVSFKSGIKTTMETGVPLIAHGQIEVSAKLRWRLCAWSLCHQ
ncbi:hypothetical protein ACFX16_030710 [Malus domestica]